MSDSPDKKQQARLEAEALDAREFRLQLWAPPNVSSWPVHHQDPLLLDYGTLFIFLSRVRQNINTASPLSWRGNVYDRPSTLEVKGGYNLSQLARESLIGLIREKQLMRRQDEVPCVTLDDFQQKLLERVVTYCKDDFAEAMFYYQLVHERLSDWRRSRGLVMTQEALHCEAFERECAAVFEKYLRYCQCWIDKTPYVTPLGHEVSLRQVGTFLNNLENAPRPRPEAALVKERQSALTIAAFLRQTQPHEDVYFLPGFSSELLSRVRRYVAKSDFDPQAGIDRLMVQVLPPMCRACRTRQLLKNKGASQGKQFCIDCMLLESARSSACNRFTLEESRRRIHQQLVNQHKFCKYCLRQFLKTIGASDSGSPQEGQLT